MDDSSRVFELASELFSRAQSLNDKSLDSAMTNSLRDQILNLTTEIQTIVREPLETLRSHTNNASQVSLHFIKRFDIANLIPMDGGISYGELAAQCCQSETTIRRMLRHASGLGIFRENLSERQDKMLDVCHTPTSMLLRDPAISAWLGATCDETWPASTKTVDALAMHPSADEPTACGWAVANANNGQRRSLYDGLAEDKSRAAQFAKGMQTHSAAPAFSPVHMISSCRQILQNLATGSTFVDVGGGLGNFSIAVGQVFPHLQFVVQDTASVIHGAQQEYQAKKLETATSKPSITFQTHDFFTPQPVRGAAVYFMRYILHNWSDKYAIQVLRHIGNAMQSEHSRLIILDHCMENLDQLSPSKRQEATSMDIGMMSMLNAKERDASEWKRLISQADSRFQWIGVTRPPGSALAIIEASWKERVDESRV